MRRLVARDMAFLFEKCAVLVGAGLSEVRSRPSGPRATVKALVEMAHLS